MRAASVILIVVLMSGALFESPAHAQQQVQSQQAKLENGPSQLGRPKFSKTELAGRFVEIKREYATVKAAVEKFVPLAPDAPVELKVTRLKIDAAMRSYEHYESRAKKQRDHLDLLVDMTVLESQRLQMAMDRLANMRVMIANLVKQINETGDALVKEADTGQK